MDVKADPAAEEMTPEEGGGKTHAELAASVRKSVQKILDKPNKRAAGLTGTVLPLHQISPGNNPPKVTQATDEGPKVVTAAMRRFGRRKAVDLRDSRFMLAAAIPLDGLPIEKIHYAPAAIDQGDTPECVAFQGTMYLWEGPTRNRKGEPDLAWTHELYKRCKLVDEWPGEDYDGTSIRACAKVFQADGYIGEYRWAPDVSAAIYHCAVHGPLMAGTWWTEGMLSTDGRGYVHATGQIVGGHAWNIVGVNRKRRNPDGSAGAFRGLNSWGTGWGEKGRFWISFNDMATLLREAGEICTAMEIFRPRFVTQAA